MNISKNIKEERIAKNISQVKLAKETGISQQAISTYENGKAEPTISVCIKLANYFNITLEELIGEN